jgi:FkbM family methyltransferase
MAQNSSDRNVANGCGPIRRFCQAVQAQWRFRFVLPSIREVNLQGVRLDVRDISLIMRNRLLNGRYEVTERQMAEQFLAPTDAVLEIGGAIGFLGIYCQKRLGILRYATVEANPKTACILRNNYALNDLEPILFNVALADHDGEVDLCIGGEFVENSICSSDLTARCRTKALCFESLLKRLCFPVNALMVDIEGAEKFINWRSLPTTVEKVIMELHPSIIGVPETYRIVTDLVNQGFTVESEVEKIFFFKKTLHK